MPRGRERFRRLGYDSAPLAGADRGGRGGMLRRRTKRPRRARQVRDKTAADAHGRLARREPPRRLAGQCGDDCSRGAAARRTESGARSPASGASAAIASECRRPSSRRSEPAGNAAAGAQRVDGVAGAERGLDRGRDNAPSVGDRRARTPAARRAAPCRVAASADCPARPAARPDPAAAASREIRDVAMACMRRIERSAQQPDAHPPPIAEPWQRISRGRQDAPARSRAPGSDRSSTAPGPTGPRA